MDSQSVVELVKAKFGEGVLEASEFRGEYSLLVSSDIAHDCLKYLHDELSFEYLVIVTAIDFGVKAEHRFQVVYQLRSLLHKLQMRIKTNIKENQELESVVDIYKSATWDERETYDMFGIVFINHPDLRRILMPQDWTGYPLRKDYPLKGRPEDDAWLDKHLPLGQLKRPRHTRKPFSLIQK
ncbi:NADH-ubiquinone oxidoreductase chain C [Desulfurella amilsii]|uniref:NADH-quinone oxidoreductase subunit C n=1 Tax=Desulfurella amilsii TaxID=1562698 RepID=A0A1X4XUD0_9BACT|nr:NADH-quinone oxidoreductase subunit C [Desulfurella amilsii]OSS41143.1 NADH-ubiquinone oxidoreductase chain C [Desulfurella amilsii]